MIAVAFYYLIRYCGVLDPYPAGLLGYGQQKTLREEGLKKTFSRFSRGGSSREK